MSKEPLLYGGQAVIRGVMMRSPRFFSVACRRESGEIKLQVEPVAFPNRHFLLKLPFVRGAMALVDAMHLGIKALFWSANVAMQDVTDEEAKSEKEKKERAKAKTVASKAVNDVAIGGAMFTGLSIGVFLFIILPNVVSGLLEPGVIQNKLGLNAVEGFLRITFFLVYVAAVGTMKNIREVFQYHGAEHRVINTFEAGKSLELKSTEEFGTIHIRCGTNFVLIVLILSIFVFSLLPWNSVIERIAMRLALLPLIAGIAYEIIRLAARNPDSFLMHIILLPGLLVQRITTRPPSDEQVEVALTALEAVVRAEAECLPEKETHKVTAPAAV